MNRIHYVFHLWPDICQMLVVTPFIDILHTLNIDAVQNSEPYWSAKPVNEMPKVYVHKLCVVIISSSPVWSWGDPVQLTGCWVQELPSPVAVHVQACLYVCMCLYVALSHQTVLSGSCPSAPQTKYTGLLRLTRVCGHCLLSTQLLADRAWPIYRVKLFWHHIWHSVC